MFKTKAQYLGSSQFVSKKTGTEYRKADFYFNDSLFSLFLNLEQYTKLNEEHDKGTQGELAFDLSTGTNAIFLNFVSFS